MMSELPRRAAATLALSLGLSCGLSSATARAELPKVPEGFTCRLVASVPAVAYPCQVAAGPGGRLFVAEDPMDQVGPYEADHGRILLFRDGDDPVVFADGLRAVFGMAWHDGALYVMHMPYLSVLRDADGDGRADDRRDLFTDLGPRPRPGALNDHIVSGLQFGMDGWLYISVGDKGVPGATRPEDGQVVRLKGGGTMRCRPDGTGLEVFTTGTRNHLEPNLDDRDNLFTYDNTDDGDGWWTRVTHHVDGGYYGYAYDYHDRPDRMLPRMAEYGGGSPCGAVLYKEDAWPLKYRGLGFWAEWGKGKVQAFRFEPDGASFQVGEAIDFMLPQGGDNFHPIDLALSDDGKTLYVADWNMGGWGNKEEKVGRVFAVTYAGEPDAARPRGSDSDPLADQIRQLDHPAYSERMRAQRAIAARGREALDAVRAALLDASTPALARRHLVWALDAIAGGTPDATVPLIDLLKSPEADLRAQAARALGQRRAPLDSAVEGLRALVEDPEPTVRLQALIALGRIGDPAAVPAVLPALAEPDVFLAFGARVALRRIGDWDAAAEGFRSDDPGVRLGVLRAMEQQYHPRAVAHLIARASDEACPPDERATALRFAAEVHRRARPWNGAWWGTRPTRGRPPARVLEWEGTADVMAAVRRGLTDPEPAVRLAAIEAVRTTDDRESLAALADRFAAEPDAEVRATLARTLGAMKHAPALPALVAALRGDAPEAVREAVIEAVEAIGTDAATEALVQLLGRPDLPDAVRPRVIAALGKFRARPAVPALVETLGSPSEEVRVAAAGALARIGEPQGAAPALRGLLGDPSLEVRRAAIEALGTLRDRESVAALTAAAEDEATRYEAMAALAEVADVKALQVYLRGLTDVNPGLRQASQRALTAIRDEAAPILEKLAERRELPPSVIAELHKVYAGLVPVTEWRVLGPVRLDAVPLVGPDGSVDLDAPQTGLDDRPLTWKLVKAVDRRGQVDLGRAVRGDNRAAFGYAEVRSPTARRAEVAVGSDDTLTVWLNGRQVFEFGGDRGYAPEQDRFEVELAEGVNRLVVKCGNRGGGWQYSVAVAAPADYAFLAMPAAGGFNPEEYREFALSHPGRPERGRALFDDPKGLACAKCHKVAGQGGSVGPDLTGLGGKYAATEIIESVLYPSAKIFSGYEPVVVATADGRVLTGIVKSDDESGLVIQDAEDQAVAIPRGEIEERRFSDVSLMPNGLAEGLSKQDFADLIAYLTSLREAPPASAGGR